MTSIQRFAVEHQTDHCITDEKKPYFSWYFAGEEQGIRIRKAVLKVGDWEKDVTGIPGIHYDGETLQPRKTYRVTLTAEPETGETLWAETGFETGRMGEGWTGHFITDPAYRFTEKHVSPKVMVFRKKWKADRAVASARLYSTALGVYRAELNGKRVGEDYFTPGFTSYRTNLQYQVYDVTGLLEEENELRVTVAGGWAVGSFVFTRVNRQAADKQALCCDLLVRYTDGTEEVLGTDESWEVTTEGPFGMADLYDGEEYDARIRPEDLSFHRAGMASLRIRPELSCGMGIYVRRQEEMEPVSVTEVDGELIYDFGQNFAGILHLEILGKEGQEVILRHAEILHPDRRLNTDFLRSAKATIRYICREGQQVYEPTFTYMGFRYASVKGVKKDQIRVKAYALYSDLESVGSFTCSHEGLNRLQENIRWGARSNFVEIPTDCPQRDERMGWTGDIALFAPTAVFNFDMTRFLTKWLKDMRAEQAPTGGIPNTIPSNGYGFPATMPLMAIDFWGDASVLVPYALYQATGEEQILRDNYRMMKKYVKACRFWAGFLSAGQKRYIWNTLPVFHFGDWVAPDEPTMQGWQRRSKWTATASLCNTSGLLARIAGILGEKEDEEAYRELSRRTAESYRNVFTDGRGKLLEEFQTGYVLPIRFGMFRDEEETGLAAKNLAQLVKKNGYRIGTGFPGTPNILFALADHGQEETAFSMLLNDTCPSWLYEVKMGATTIWERWDGLDESGNCPIGDDGTDQMISYNHYASGAVGAFLYQRIAGIEPLEAGYRRFRVKPLLGGGLTFAKAETMTPYGPVRSSWEYLDETTVKLAVSVPVGASCQWCLPDGQTLELGNGSHEITVHVEK